jgi:hypothetical protein
MDIVVWLRSLGLGKYEAAFRENEIDETVLPSLTEEHLKQLGVTALGHRVKLLEAAVRPDPIDEWQPRTDLVACDFQHPALFVERARGDFGRVGVDGDGRDAVGRRNVAQMLAERRLIDCEIVVERQEHGRTDAVRDIGTHGPPLFASLRFWHRISSSGHSHRGRRNLYFLPGRPPALVRSLDSRRSSIDGSDMKRRNSEIDDSTVFSHCF